MELLLVSLGALLIGIVVGAWFNRSRSPAVAPDLEPLRSGLDALRDRAERLHAAQIESQATIAQQLRSVHEQYGSLHDATNQIAQALHRGHTRGQLGEMQLEQILTHSGLLEGVHYERQRRELIDDSVRIPDIIIRLPHGGEVPVDVKFPFEAFWSGIEDPQSRPEAIARFARDVLSHVQTLAGRGYGGTTSATDFVVMFLPFESLLTAALEGDPLLLEKAFERRVILATPSTMLALVRTIGLGHERVVMAEHAEQIRHEGAQMLNRLGTLLEHLEAMRKGLGAAVSGYNNLIGSFERQALPQARRMRDLGVPARKSLDTPAEIADPRPAG
jgi:DNA recombination protein RmuC